MTRPSIIATLGPASHEEAVLESMIDAGMNYARLNLSWGDSAEHSYFTSAIRRIASRKGIHIPIIYDLSGPREQGAHDHHFKEGQSSPITQKDRKDILLGIENRAEYFALSYVGSGRDVEELRRLLDEGGSTAKIIAKIERKIALAHIDDILASTDAIMVARGDLGHEVPLAEIPFDEMELIRKAREASVPVIVATDMMPSMIEKQEPTRSDVTDVAFAAIQGADAVMLSNETTKGKYPVETITMMATILAEAARRGYAHDHRSL